MAGDRPCSSDPISFVELVMDTHIWHPPLLYDKFLVLFDCKGAIPEGHSVDVLVHVGG